MATIQEAYQAACNAGFIKRNEFSEEAFGNMLQNDNNRRAYYDHVTKIDPTFYSKDYDTFSQNVLSALGQPAAKNSTNQPSNAAPAPSQVQPTFQPAQGQPTFWQSIGAHDPYPQKTAEGVAQFEKEQQLQRESAATMPLSQQDKDRQAEIQRLQTEGIWGKPNGITMDIDKQTGLPTINQTKGDGMHLSIGATPANQDEIDRLKAEQPSYITREIKTPQDLYTSVSEAWAANTPDGQKAKAELNKTAQDTYNNLLADMNRQIADLQQQVNNGTVTQQQAQQEAQRIADNANAVYENKMQLAQDYFFRQMTDANADYLSQQARLLGQKATNQTISDINARIAPHIQQLETERQQTLQRANKSAQGSMYGAIGASMSANTAYKPEKDQELALYHQSQQFLADAAKISDAAQKGEGFWKGLGKSLGDIDTWDFGISQLTRSANLKDIVEKYERGEQLTDAEKGLMDSAVAYMSACAYNSDKINRRYKMGQTTGESIPFMLQFMVMPIGAIKDKVAKGVLGYGIEQFGGKAAQAAGKVAAKYGAKTAFKEAGTLLLSNLAAAGVQTAAFGVPKIAEGAISRMTGDIQPTITEQGNIAYNGRRNQQSAASAVWNSAVDMYAENLSEMILTSLDPLKAYAGTAKLFSGLKNSQIAQVLGRLNEGVIGKVRDRVQFRNYLEEVGEEYVGNLIRWGLSTDVNNAEDAGLSADRQIDTWLGLAPTSIAFGAANIVEGGIDRFQSSRAAKRLREIMADGDKRRYLESLLKSRNSDDFSKNAHEVIKSVLRDKELNEDTKRLIMDGIYYTYQSQLAQEAEQARVQAEAERQTQPEQQPEQSAQQEIGQQTASAAESEANQEGEEHYQDADGNEVTFYRNADGSVSLRDENDNAAVDEHGNAVVLTQAEFDKYTQDTNLRRVDRELSADQWAERENELRQQYASEIRPNTHNDGNVYEVALASEGNKHGYIVGDGNVEIDDTTDNAAPRITNSDVVTVRYEDGTMEQVAAKDLNLLSVGSANDIVEQRLQPFQQYAQAMQTFRAGQEVTMDDGSGNTYTSHVVSVSTDGVEVEIENAQGEPDTTIIPNEIALTALHPVEQRQRQPEQQVEKQEPFEFVKTDPFGNPIVVEQPEQIPTTPQKIVPNIDTMLADELGASVVEYLGDKASAIAYLEAERDKADDDVKRLAKQKVTRYTDIADFKRQNDELQAAKKATADRYNKLQNAIATANNYKTKVEQAAEAERKAREEERRATRRQTQTAQLANAAPAERWKAAPKVEGNAVTRTLSDGTVIKGHYILVEAGAATPSHDPFNGWNTSNGFPVTDDGKNINDRDYKNDTDAQQITTQIAQTYDGQAVAQVPVVSSEGIVYDGNGRTIAGNIAAANNTDGAYIQALADNAGNFGFAPEQVAGMQHPRVYMQTDEDLPYNTTTFAKFNAQEKKSQGSTNRAVSSSKKLTEAARDGMLRILDNYGTLDAFFASEAGAKDIVHSLLDNGIITQQEVAGLTENTDRGFVLSPAGKDYVTDLLIGGLFDEQTIRMLGNDKGLKQSILRAMPSIVENRRLGDYALTDNINNAIRLLYEARQAGMAYPLYVKQGNAFDGYVSDRFSPFEMLLAEEMSSGVETFRQVLNLYNNSARDEANGQTGLFEPRTIEDIKNEILQHYGKSITQSAATAAESTQSRPANTQTEPPAPSAPAGDGQEQIATDIPASNILEQIEAEAEPFEEIELTPANWYALFGEDGIVSTPIGYVKMGEHQYLKLAQKGRDGKLGMIKPTLEHPSVVVMDKSQAKDGQNTEREFSYVFVKAFVGKNGERLYYFTSITVSKDGQEVVISNQEKERSRIQRLLKNGKLAYINKATLPPASDKTIQGDQLTNPVGEELSSADKGTKNIPNSQTPEQKSAENLPNASQDEQSHTEEAPKDEQSKDNGGKEQSQSQQSENKIFTEDAYEAARRRMHERLNRLNAGLDPEMLSDGLIMAGYHVEKGARKFAEFAREMIREFGDKIRPYLKSFYNGLRDLPEAVDLSKEMDDYSTVMQFDVNSISIERAKETKKTSDILPSAGESVTLQPKKVDVEGLFGALNTKGEAKLSDHIEQESLSSANAEDTQPIGNVTQSKHTKTGEDIWIVKPSERVSDDEFKLLKARAKANNGYYSSFAKNRGFIFKSKEDANNFNNISDEEITTDQTSADTETAVRTAETVVGETATITRDRRDSNRAEGEPGTESIEGGVREPRNVELTPEQANEQVTTRQQAIAKIDNANDKITDQLAVLGFYEADTSDPTKLHESYGYIKTAEAKAVKDIDRLAKQLADDLGIKVSKRKMIAKANIAPAGGDISFRLPLENGKELYLWVDIEPNIDNYYRADGDANSLVADHIVWRIEDPQANGTSRYLTSNQNYGMFERGQVTTTYADLLRDIRRTGRNYLPTIPAGTTKQEIAKQVAEKTTRKKKDTTRIADTQSMLDLFGDVAETMNEGAQQEQDGRNPQASTDEELRHGYNVGDKVQYQGKTAEIVGFDNGRLVLDLMGSGWNTKLARFDEVEPINTNNNGDTTEIRTDGRGENGTAQTEPTRQSRDENGTLGGSEQPQDERPVGRRVDTGSKPHRVHDGERSAGTPVQPTEQTVTQSEQTDIEPSQWHNTHNFHARGGERLSPTAPKARYEANLAAIRLLKQLQDEGRQATAQEKDILAQYSGWGGLGEFFKGEPGTTYYSQQGEQSPYQVLQSLLTDEELQAAQLSRNSAYYTPESVINSMWQVAERLGFKGGNILEGSAGIGNIFALMPSDISHRSNLTAVEIDDITAGILSQLYPDATTYHAGFQDVDIPNNSQDLVITNVPFVTGLHVYDKQEKDLSKRFGNIHDFCIAKNVRKLKQGGLGIFISSSGTLDNSKDLRVWLNNEGDADVIGAFRLNRETFGGTSATSDIIVVRKRVNGQKDPRSIDVLDTATDRIAKQPQDEVFDKYTNQFKKPADKEIKLVYNKYFVEHPLSMGGEMGFGFEHGDTRWGGTTAGCYPEPTINQSARLKDWIDSIEQSEQLPTYDELKQGAQVPNGTYETYEGAVPYGSLILNSKGEICKAYHGTAVPVEGINSNKVKGYSKSQVLKDYNAIKQAIDNLLQAQTKNVSDSELKPYLQQLNKVYDDFVRKYGNLNRNTSLAFLRNDVQWASVAAIEKVKETVDVNGKKKIQVAKTDLFSKRVVGVQAVPKAENTRDGIILSMQQFGTIRPDKIAEWLGKPTDEVEKEIIGTRLGFRDPQTGNIQVRYEYLSGNVREKLAYAVEHNENGSLDANIEELRKVIPIDIPAHLIEFNIGSTWIPKELYLQYAKEKYDLDNLKLNHVGSAWVSNDVWGRNEKNRSEGVYSDMLGIQIYGHELMLAAMNNVPVVVSRVEKHSDGTSETRTDKVASAACSDKISQIKDDFVDWARGKMQQDSELADRIQKIYNDRFNAIVPMLKVDKEFLSEHLPGQNSAKYTLYPHQQQAVARGLTQALMLAHEVGTGKTISLISTAMEMRRLGTAKKPMIVVQNATTQQFVADAKDLYPNAKILTVSDRDRTAEGRQEFYAKIKYNDWDLIIVPQSVFDMIPDSEARMRDFINEKIEEKMHAIEAAKEAGLDNNVTKRMERELGMLQEDLETNNMSGKRSGKKAKEKDAKKEAEQRANTEARAQAMLDRKTDDIENFDEMGIDALLIDEAHNYKHLGFATMMTRGVKGVDPSYSKRAAALYLKCQSIYERNGHKNVIFATGTPISNTAAEIWTFMKYLMPKQTLQENEIYYFDDFVHNFGKINEQLEFATNGKFKANNRFAQYGNVPELMRLWLSVADCTLTREVGQVNDKVPELEGGKAQDIFLPQSPSLIDIMSAVRSQLEMFEKMSGKEKRENSYIPLTMYGIAKRAAIDPRLVDANAVDEPLSKTNRAVEEILRSLNDSKKYKGTVAIFCDSYQNKQSGFNLFNDIKEKLTKQGVSANQIAIIRSEMSDSAKQKIFNAVREGDIRVIMGSTQTLGTGVNIQTRLHTLIHMDAPDRPMDYTQRNGRILRQGNMHKEWGVPVRVLRFGVEGSLDVTSYQRLKTKAGFIDSVMNGKSMIENNLENRVLEDVDEGIFDNPVAMLSGSQYALLKSQAERDLRKWSARAQQYRIDQILIAKKTKDNEKIIAYRKQKITDNEKLIELLSQTFPEGKVSEYNINGTVCHTVEEIKNALKEVNKDVTTESDTLRKNVYGIRKVLSYPITLNGVSFNVDVQLTRKVGLKDGQSIVSIEKEVLYSAPTLGIEPIASPTKVIDRLIDMIQDDIISGKQARNENAYSADYIKRLEKENALMREREGKPFEHQAELEKAQTLVDEYTKKMQAELAEKEAKYANQSHNSVNLDKMDSEDDTTDTPEAQYDELDYDTDNLTDAQQLATDAVLGALDDAGISVERVSEEEAEREVAAQKKSLDDTATWSELMVRANKAADITSNDNAKVLQKIETAKQKIANQSGKNIKNIAGVIADAAELSQRGSSHYGTFKATNGDVFTIRVSNHNATVSNFDNENEADGVSIVISNKPNIGISNDGSAHIVEYFYRKADLLKSYGNPIADILGAIKTLIESGEYTDPTGLAQRQEVNIPAEFDSPEFSIVYHGSGNKFSHFDHSHMGEGEGQQAYGWGTYVTQVKNIGKDYAVASAKQNDKTFLGLINRPGKRYLYTVEIPNNAYIPFEQQVGNYIATTINNALKKQFGINRAPVQSTDTGQKVYQYLVKGFKAGKSSNAPRTASLFLSKLGFTGLSYPANYQTGGRADGARNYVIFNEDDLQIKNRAEFLRTSNGTIYGYAKDGKIYLTDKGFNPNTPIHEYAHLWVKAVRNNNTELYDNLRDLFSRENLPDMWNELDNDPQYRDLSDEAKLSEIIARFSGKRGAERMEQEAQKLIDDAKQEGKRAVADAVSFRERMRNLLRRFWNWVGEHLFHIKHFGSREEAADRVLYDLLNATDLHQPPAEKDSKAEFSISPMPKRIEGEMVHEWAKRIAEWKRQQIDEQQVAEYAKLLDQNDSKKSKVFAYVVDKFTPIDNFQQWVQAQGGVYDEDTMDMHGDLGLALGRTDTFSRRYKEDYMQRIADSITKIVKADNIADPLLALGLKWQNFDNKKMNGKPLTVREIMGVYAQAKDTWEAEQQGLSDRGAQGFVKNLGASHTDIIEAVERIIPQEQLDEFWNAVYAANQFALDYQLKAGMIDQNTRDRYTRRYYVPQRGWRERDFDGIDTAYIKDNGNRLYGNPYNAALVKAHGRESLASDPFALIESIGLTSIIQSEHNKSKQQLLNLLLANEMLGLKSGAWRVKQVWSKNVIDPRTGHIMRKPDGTPVQAEVTYAAPTQQEREHDADINARIDQLRKELRDLTQPAARAKRESEIADLQDQLIYTGRATDTMLEHRTRDERMQHQVIVLKDGQQYIIELQDARLANAVNGNFGEAWKAYTMFNKLNAPAIRYVSGMLTQYNPRFAHRNFWRDAQAAFLNNLSEQGLAFTTRAMANIPAVQRTVWQYILADTYKNKESYGGQFGDYLREYFEAGAQTGFSFMPELERMAKDFDKMVKGENAWDKVWGKGVKGTLSLMTEASELTVRFAEYVTARQMGRSVQAAAKMAKNISVNFNQSGLMSKEFSKFFTFFNATIQGNMRFLTHYGKNKPKFGERALKFGAKFAGTAANFVLLGFVSTWFQPDDPDDDTWFTEYDRMSNFILFGKVKIPVVHFFRMFYAAGVQAALAAQGRKTWKDAFLTSAGYIHGELVPSSALQILSIWDYDETTNTLELNPAKYAQAAAPSVISPLVDVAVNRDFKGATVYRKKWDEDKKDITTAKRNTPQWAIDVSNTLHRWSGGNPDVPYKGGNTDGWIDIKPNAIEHIAQGYFSGVWESLGHTAGFIWDGAHDTDVFKHATNWPFLRDLFRDYNEEKAYNQQYYSVLQKLEKYEKRVNTLPKDEFNAEKQTNRFQTFKQVSKQLRRLPNPYNDEETTVTSEDVNKILQLDIELNRNLFTD